jgi:hypothetical protein
VGELDLAKGVIDYLAPTAYGLIFGNWTYV